MSRVLELVVAIGLAVVSAVVHARFVAWIQGAGAGPHVPEPLQVVAAAWPIAALLIVGAIVVTGASRAWAWLAVPGLPAGMLRFADLAEGGQLAAPGTLNLAAMAPALRMQATDSVGFALWALAAFALLGGPSRVGWRRGLAAAAWVCVWFQAVFVGMQILVPGIVAYGLFALLPVVVTRMEERTGWARRSLRDLLRAPTAAVVLVLGDAILSQLLTLAAVAAVSGPLDEFFVLLEYTQVDPFVLPWWSHIVGRLTMLGISGVTYLLAARSYDRAAPPAAALADGALDRANPWAAS